MSTQPPGWPEPPPGGWPGQPAPAGRQAPASGLPPSPTPRRSRFPLWTVLILGAVAVAAILIVMTQRRGGVMNPYELGMRNPLTPEQAKAQVVDAAEEIVSVAGVPVMKDEATVYLDSCNDQGEAPFRGLASIWYPLAPSGEDAKNDTAAFLRALEGAGWTVVPSPYPGRPPISAEKNGVTVSFEVQGNGKSTLARVITAQGECRDVTTTRDTRPSGERIPGL